MRENCSYSELFWSAFFRIRTEYGEIRSNYPYSARIRENTDQDNSEYGQFSRNECSQKFLIIPFNAQHISDTLQLSQRH